MQNNSLRIVEPVSSLRAYIRHYVIIPGGGSAGGGVFLPYSGAIVSFFNEAPLVVNGKESGVMRQTEPTLFGPVAEPIVYQRQMPKSSRDVSVVFTAFGSALLCGPVLNEVESTTADLDRFFPRWELERLQEELYEARSTDAIVAILDNHLQTALAKCAKKIDTPILRILRDLETPNDQRSPSIRYDVGALKEQLYLSARQLQRVMLRTTGFTPKRYLSVLRINRVVEQIHRAPAPRFSQIAADFGYTDQAHFIRDFERNTLSKPSEFFRSLAHEEHRGFMDVG